MKIVILNYSPSNKFFSVDVYKVLIKNIIGRFGGPQSVVDSVRRGFDVLGIKYEYNPPKHRIGYDDVVWVNNSAEALMWAINMKRKNKISKLLVGPSIGRSLTQSFELSGFEEINIIFQPSQWVADWFTYESRQTYSLLRVWPAGVSIPLLLNKNYTYDVLIYVKKPSDINLVSVITHQLKKNNLSFVIFEYGKFTQSEYFDCLLKVKCVIYLSDSESQGIALQEAWARDVPTFVWDRGYFWYESYYWKVDRVSCPYLTTLTGATFRSGADFLEKFLVFWSNLNSFTPRDFVISNLSDEKCAKKFMSIVNEVVNK